MLTDFSEGDRELEQQLAFMQLADSFFPSGSYTLSHGLESLVQAGAIATAEDVAMFLRLLLRNKVGSTDLVALSHAYRVSARADGQSVDAGAIDSGEIDREAIARIDARLFAQTPIEKTRAAQRQSGRALLMVASSTWPHPHLAALSEQTARGEIHCLHPVVFGAVARVAGIGPRGATLAFAHGFVTGLLGAAIRLGAVGHLQAQQIRLKLAPEMASICAEAETLSLDEMWSCTPSIDLAQMRQAKLSRRLFAS